jgi:hypothetical protein
VGAKVSKKKLFLRIGLGLAGLIVVAAIAVPLVVPIEKWQQIAFDRLREETGLVATAESASVGLLPLGLRMQGLQVRDPENRPEWSGLELDLEEVVVTAQIRPLFSGRFEIDEVKLVRPRVVLAPASGESAAANSGGDGAGGASAPDPAAPLSIALAALTIEDGYVELNQPDGSSIVLHGLTNVSSVNIEGGAGNALAKGQLDSLILVSAETSETIAELGWALDVDFAADGSGGTVAIERAGVPGAEFKGEAKWQAGESTAVEARLDLSADIGRLATDWYRSEDIEWPEGVDPSQFGDFSGNFSGEVVISGELDPSATPEEMARMVSVRGTLSDLSGRMFDRADLATVHAEVRFADALLDVEPLRVVTPVGEMTGKYRARPLSEDDARLEMAGEIELAATTELVAGLWPALLPLMEEGATPPAEWPAVRGSMELEFSADLPVDPDEEPRITWAARAGEVNARPVDVDADFVFRDVRVGGDAENVALRDGVVTGPGLEIRPRLDIALEEGATRVTGRVDATTIDLDQLQSTLAPPVETAMGNWFVGVAHAEEAMWIPPADLSVDVQLSAQTVLASGHRLESVAARAKLGGQKLEVRDIEAGLADGSIVGAADVDYTQDPPQWSTRIRASDVPASVLLAPDAPKLAGALDTRLSGDLSFDGKVLTDPAAATQALTGDLVLGASSGMFRTEPILGQQVSQFVGQHAPKWQELAFAALDAELKVEQGQVHFDRFLLSGDTQVRAGGKVGLDGRCDYRLDIVLPASATPDVGALQPVVDYLRDEEGRFPFAVNVTGPAKKPKVQIDFDALRERAEDRGRDELEDKVEDTVKGLWDKLKGGK